MSRPSVDPNTHRLPVRAEVENPDGELKPEMFASFSIITGPTTPRPGGAGGAPSSTRARRRASGSPRDDRSLALRQIRVGRISDGMVEVLAGLDSRRDRS